MKRHFIAVLLACMAITGTAQVPQALKYQSVIRDASGNPIINQLVSLRLSVLQKTESGPSVYSELINKMSSPEGLLQAEVGLGDPISFKSIDWADGPYYMKVELDPAGGTSYQLAGISQIMSVPYAFMAGNADYHASMVVRTDPEHPADSALFIIRDRNGEPVFAVYENGVEVTVDEPLAKGGRGGFAVSGRGPGKGLLNPILQVDQDSFRVYLNDSGKGGRGGFAVGSRAAGKDYAVSHFMQLTPENYFIGEESGSNISSGMYNSFLGYRAGYGSTTASNNVFLGYLAGQNNISGSSNVFLGTNCGINNISGGRNAFIGNECGFSNKYGGDNVFVGNSCGSSNIDGSGNVFLGVSAGYKNTSGFANNFFGDNAGYSNTEGTNNTFIGSSAGYSNELTSGHIFIGVQAGYAHTTGWQNIYIGNQSARNLVNGANNVVFGTLAGSEKTAGDVNVLIGAYAGQNGGTGSNNVYLGPHAGRNATGSFNVFIGSSAGYDEAGSGKLYIANSEAGAPLVFGDFTAGQLVINGIASDNTSSRNLFVNGSAGGKYGWFNDSDARLKTNIETVPDAIKKVMRLRGVNFTWLNPDAGMEGKQLGFIAQEVFPVLPEVVQLNNDHYTMEYAAISALLVEAVKEQQQQIALQASKIAAQEVEIARLKQMEEQIQNLIKIVGKGE
ncbi:MAG: tail fiber domain-containing protein [Bacteroidales bacterium]